MINTGIHVRTPSRLHFGLLGWGPQVSRQFGGVGLMIESPGIHLVVEPAAAWRVDGPHAARIQRLLDELARKARETNVSLPPVHILVVNAPPEHVGLGVGTQLCLAASRAIFQLAGMGELTAVELAQWTGRGRRSGIGLHGFEHGGLIVDGGRRNETDIPPLLARLPFPEDWSILVVQPPGKSGLSGPDEHRAFAALPPFSQSVTESVCRLVLLEILPAVIERDLASFGAALGELQRQVGACFAPAQGGIYATGEATQIVAELRDLGFVGVGQSSWGPTLYGFSTFGSHDLAKIAERLRQRFGLHGDSVFATRVSNQGASISSGQ